MTFGTINIEKSLVAQRDTAESKTDDRGQLTIIIVDNLKKGNKKAPLQTMVKKQYLRFYTPSGN